MFCSKCGNALNGNEKYCMRCGNLVKLPETAVVAVEVPAVEEEKVVCPAEPQTGVAVAEIVLEKAVFEPQQAETVLVEKEPEQTEVPAQAEPLVFAPAQAELVAEAPAAVLPEFIQSPSPVTEAPVYTYDEEPSVVPKKKKSKSKIIAIVSIILVLVIAVGTVGVVFGIPYFKYVKAKELLEQGEFDQAKDAFFKLDGFMDSEELAKEALYRKAGKFFEEGKYKDAYKIYKELKDYEDTQEKTAECIYAWVDALFEIGSATSSAEFKDTVKLTEEHYKTVYNTIREQIDSHTDFDYWDDSWFNTENSQTLCNILEALPYDYEETARYKKLFGIFSSSEIHPLAEYIPDNLDYFESVWDIEVVKDFLTINDSLEGFLVGYWTDNDGYFLSFEQNSPGISTNFNIPWVEEPDGTKYYDIVDNIFMWTDYNNQELAKVFKITVVDFNTIKVYSYKNNRTYTLTR